MKRPSVVVSPVFHLILYLQDILILMAKEPLDRESK